MKGIFLKKKNILSMGEQQVKTEVSVQPNYNNRNQANTISKH